MVRQTGPTLIGLFGTFLVILAVLQVVFPRREGFGVPTKATSGTQSATCEDDSQCTSPAKCITGKCTNR
jgi:hypothetical protein